MTNLDSILKSRHYSANKGPYSQSYGFPVVMYGYENWNIKKAKCQRIDFFELWCWNLRVPWTARRSNQSILKEISPEYSLEGLMSKLKLRTLATWCKELTHWKRPWCWERLRAEEGDNRGCDGWMASLTQRPWVWTNSRRQWRTQKPGVLQSMGWQSQTTTKWLNNNEQGLYRYGVGGSGE